MTLPSVTRPSVSIVTPSFNQGRFIASAIDSVLVQDYPNIDYLVVDAGSTDETLDLLAGYGSRLRWISEPDGGQADGIDKGIRRTTGEIVGWLNADDLYVPGAVSRAVEAFASHPTVAGVYGGADYIDETGAFIGRCTHIEPFDLCRLIDVLDFIVQPATFFTRAAYLAAGGLDNSLHYCLDYDLWIKMGRAAPLHHVGETLAHVRLYPDTKTASGGLARLVEIERMIQRHGRPSLPEQFQPEMVRAALISLMAGLRDRHYAQAGHAGRYALEYGARTLVRRLRSSVGRP